MRKYIVPLQASNPQLPIMFSDIGMNESVLAPYIPVSQTNEPYVFSDLNANGVDDGREQQANIYQALFNINRGHDYLLRGTVFFGYAIDTDPSIALYNETHRVMEFHNKPAERVIRDAYAEMGALPGGDSTLP